MPRYYASIYVWEEEDNPKDDVVIASRDTNAVTAINPQHALSILSHELVQTLASLRQSVITETPTENTGIETK